MSLELAILQYRHVQSLIAIAAVLRKAVDSPGPAVIFAESLTSTASVSLHLTLHHIYIFLFTLSSGSP